MYICSFSKGKRVQVFFDLVFNGQIIREEIEKILRVYFIYEDKDGFRYFKFRDFIVDINKIFNLFVFLIRGLDIEIIGIIVYKYIYFYKVKYKVGVVFLILVQGVFFFKFCNYWYVLFYNEYLLINIYIYLVNFFCEYVGFFKLIFVIEIYWMVIYKM